MGQACDHAAADGISSLGVDAKFRPRNDIEVAGRKISGTGGTIDGHSVMYQGTVLVEFDVEKMLRVLRIPAEKLNDKAIASARERVTSLAELLPTPPTLDQVKAALLEAFKRHFRIEFETRTRLCVPERVRYATILPSIVGSEWLNLVEQPAEQLPLRQSIYRCSGGTIQVAVLVDERGQRLKQTWITGDFFVVPKRTIPDLEAALKNVHISAYAGAIHECLSRQSGLEMLQVNADDFIAAIDLALQSGAPQGDVLPELTPMTAC